MIDDSREHRLSGRRQRQRQSRYYCAACALVVRGNRATSPDGDRGMGIFHLARSTVYDLLNRYFNVMVLAS